MGEKSGGLFLMVVTLVVAVAILLVLSDAFPDMTSNITDGMNTVIDNAITDSEGISAR